MVLVTQHRGQQIADPMGSFSALRAWVLPQAFSRFSVPPDISDTPLLSPSFTPSSQTSLLDKAHSSSSVLPQGLAHVSLGYKMRQF